ncbi:MAG: pectin acetylesterase-family hydrolase [Chloroflexota bacterium]
MKSTNSSVAIMLPSFKIRTGIFAISVLMILLFITPQPARAAPRPQMAPPPAANCIDFGDLNVGDTYPDGDTFLSYGQDFGSTITNGKMEVVSHTSPMAGAWGTELHLTDSRLSLILNGGVVNGLTLRFGDYNGDLEMTVNDANLTFANFADIHGQTEEGVTFSVINGAGNASGHLTLDGAIARFEVGGQDLYIDDICLGTNAPMPVAVLDRYDIDQAAHPKALYNNGTTPLFYFRRGVGTGADKWVFYFQGGGTCFDEDSCDGRLPNLTGAGPWNTPGNLVLYAGKRADGIFNPDPAKNPDFYNWNHVFMVYASSDSWAGDGDVIIDGNTWHFRGHSIVNAIFDAVRDPNIIGTPNLTNASAVLLAGSSAGASGMRHNIDRLVTFLNNNGIQDVRAIGDASISPTVTDEQQQANDVLGALRITTQNLQLDESCVAANPTAPEQCIMGSFLLDHDHIHNEMFTHQDQLDGPALKNRGLSECDPAAVQPLSDFGAEIRRILAAEAGAFSPRTGNHILITGDRFYGLGIDTPNGVVTMVDVVGNWYFNRGNPVNVIQQPDPATENRDPNNCPDLGDAPDSTNHHGQNNTAYVDSTGTPILGQFPTVYNSGVAGDVTGPRHRDSSKFWLGNSVSRESDADIHQDSDTFTNILDNGSGLDTANNDQGDDGWLNEGVPMPNCQQTTLQVQVSKAVSLAVTTNLFLNVWFDGNRDGDWQDSVPCSGTEIDDEDSNAPNQIASEWIVQNFVVPSDSIPASGTIEIDVPTGLVPNGAEAEAHWIRFTLAETPISSLGSSPVPDGRGPQDGYTYGETEDYLPQGQPVGEVGSLVLEKKVLIDDKDVTGNASVATYKIRLRHEGGTQPINAEIRDELPAPFHLVSQVDEDENVFVVNVSGTSGGVTPLEARVMTKLGSEATPPSQLIRWKGTLSPDSEVVLTFNVRVFHMCPEGATTHTISTLAHARPVGGDLSEHMTEFTVNCAGYGLQDIEVNQERLGSSLDSDGVRNVHGFVETEFTNNSMADLTIGALLNWNGCETCVQAANQAEAPMSSQMQESVGPYSTFHTIRLQAGETKSFTAPVDATRFFGDQLTNLDSVEFPVSAKLSYCILEGTQTSCPLPTVSPDQVAELTPLSFNIHPGDTGDAPDSTNHFGVNMTAYSPGGVTTTAKYPTVFDAATGLPEGPLHTHPRPFHLGRRVSLEGEADTGPDQDPGNNLDPAADLSNQDRADDGTQINLWGLTHCQRSTVDVQVFISNQAWNWFNSNNQKAYLNGWVDSDRSGDWAGSTQCQTANGNTIDVVEHIIIDWEIDVINLGPGLHNLPVLTGAVAWPAANSQAPAWVRLTLSETKSNKPLQTGNIFHGDGRGHPTPFKLGETEDYRFVGSNVQDPPDVGVQLNGRVTLHSDDPINLNQSTIQASSITASPASQWRYGIDYLIQYENTGQSVANDVRMVFEAPDPLINREPDRLLAPGFDDESILIQDDQIVFRVGTLNPGEIGRVILGWDECRNCVDAANGPVAEQLTAKVTIMAEGDATTGNNSSTITVEPPDEQPNVAISTGDGAYRAPTITTCSNNVPLQGISEPNGTVTIEIDGVEFNTTADENGRWQYIASLADGRHQVQIVGPSGSGIHNGTTVPIHGMIILVDSALPYEPTSLTFRDTSGQIVRPFHPTNRSDDSETNALKMFIDPSQQYTAGITLCGSDPNAKVQLTMAGVDGVIPLLDEDEKGNRDGRYSGQLPLLADLFNEPHSATLRIQSNGMSFVAPIILLRAAPSTVYDSQTGTPLAGATVSILQAQNGAGTDVFSLWNGSDYGQTNPQMTPADGTFSYFTPEGTFQLLVQKDGYQPYRSQNFTPDVLPIQVDVPLTTVVPNTDDDQSSERVAIQLTETGFEPSFMQVTPGTIIDWLGMGLSGHTVHSITPQSAITAAGGDAANKWDSGLLWPSERYQIKLSEAGTYIFGDSTNAANQITIIVDEVPVSTGEDEVSIFLPLVQQ